jgi:hypothetical protein
MLATLLLLAIGVSAQSDCFVNPRAPECAEFKLNDARITENMDDLCASMPYMVGCTLRNGTEFD